MTTTPRAAYGTRTNSPFYKPVPGAEARRVELAQHVENGITRMLAGDKPSDDQLYAINDAFRSSKRALRPSPHESRALTLAYHQLRIARIQQARATYDAHRVAALAAATAEANHATSLIRPPTTAFVTDVRI